MASPRMAKNIGQRWNVSDEFRQETQECEDAVLPLGVKSVNSAGEYDWDGRPMSKPHEWYEQEPHGLGREIG